FDKKSNKRNQKKQWDKGKTTENRKVSYTYFLKTPFPDRELFNLFENTTPINHDFFPEPNGILKFFVNPYRFPGVESGGNDMMKTHSSFHAHRIHVGKFCLLLFSGQKAIHK